MNVYQSHLNAVQLICIVKHSQHYAIVLLCIVPDPGTDEDLGL